MFPGSCRNLSPKARSSRTAPASISKYVGRRTATRWLFSSHQQRTINNRTGRRGPLPPPVADFEGRLDPVGKAILAHALSCSVVGSPQTVQQGLQAFIAQTGADELIVASQVFDHRARLRSYEIVAQAHAALGSAA